jgi:hypothetical protein
MRGTNSSKRQQVLAGKKGVTAKKTSIFRNTIHEGKEYKAPVNTELFPSLA